MRNGTRIETIHLRNLTLKLKYILGHSLSMLLFRKKLTKREQFGLPEKISIKSKRKCAALALVMSLHSDLVLV